MKADHSDAINRAHANRGLQITVFVLAALVTLVGLFYALENWRGKRAWNRIRQELQAKGARLDWKTFIPAPVPDDQNVFKAPRMQEWFVKAQAGPAAQSGFPGSATQLSTSSGPLLIAVARIQLVHGGIRDDQTPDLRDKVGDPQLRELLGKVMRFDGGLHGAQGLILSARPAAEFAPVRVVLEAAPEAMVNVQTVEGLLPDASAIFPEARITVSEAGTNVFTVTLQVPGGSCLAADYLAWSEQFKAEFDLIREALKRPYARMEGDYNQPFALPVPNFVALRQVAQMIAQRAQCFLLLGKPESAAQELHFLRLLSRFLQADPSGEPMTLVSAMINVAITGLYVNVVADGFRLGAWREAEIGEFQSDLSTIRLLPLLIRSVEAERAGVAHLLDGRTSLELRNIFSIGPAGGPRSLRQELEPELLLLRFQPQGWVDQNRAKVLEVETRMLEGIDAARGRVSPAVQDRAGGELQAALGGFSPYSWLAALAVPNIAKATHTVTRNQTMANEALVACALERFRIANARYPETLDDLKPQGGDMLPADVITGQPFKYQPDAGKAYVLYSVGWNERDDGGKSQIGGKDADWVWPGVPKQTRKF